MTNITKLIVVAVAVDGLLTASKAVARRKWHPGMDARGPR
jgi:hypothetical protein